jgi:AcrR family transcriptional regulator
MPRVGLTRASVVAAAATLVDMEGGAALTLTRLAGRVGVKTPSLYNHVAGLDGLRRDVALHGVNLLASAIGRAVMGLSGRDALVALAAAYREFAHEHPGLYPLVQIAHPGDAEFDIAAGRAVEPVLAVLNGYGYHGDEAIHAARALRSALHGFLALESGAGFGIDLDVSASFDRMVDMLDRALTS